MIRQSASRPIHLWSGWFLVDFFCMKGCSCKMAPLQGSRQMLLSLSVKWCSKPCSSRWSNGQAMRICVERNCKTSVCPHKTNIVSVSLSATKTVHNNTYALHLHLCRSITKNMCNKDTAFVLHAKVFHNNSQGIWVNCNCKNNPQYKIPINASVEPALQLSTKAMCGHSAPKHTPQDKSFVSASLWPILNTTLTNVSPLVNQITGRCSKEWVEFNDQLLDERREYCKWFWMRTFHVAGF